MFTTPNPEINHGRSIEKFTFPYFDSKASTYIHTVYRAKKTPPSADQSTFRKYQYTHFIKEATKEITYSSGAKRTEIDGFIKEVIAGEFLRLMIVAGFHAENRPIPPTGLNLLYECAEFAPC